MRIGVMGAGSVGCYLGGRLASAGHTVMLVGRPWLGTQLAQEGLVVTGYGEDRLVRPLGPGLGFSTTASALSDCDVVLVTVKSRDTEAVAALLAPQLAPETLVVSFQNGTTNPDVLRTHLPRQTVAAGMIPFNVVHLPPGRFHRGTSGTIAFGPSDRSTALAQALQQAGLSAQVSSDMPGVMRAKFVFNLNNAINALSGLTLREQLSDRRIRRLMAAVYREGLSVLSAAQTPPRRCGRMMPRIAPLILPLPDALFFRLASAMIQIDPEARSSMWEDLQRGRPTEIGELNGRLVALAAPLGVPVPINAHLTALVRAAEAAGSGSPCLPPASLWPH